MFGRRHRSLPADSEHKITDPERARERTMHRAGRLLAAKPRSIRELRERLLEKPWTNVEIVDGVIESLKGYNYLDDDQYAREAALSKLRQRPQGKRRLRQTMSQKKLDKETVDASISHAFEIMPEVELIELAIQKRVRLKGKPETRDDAKKFCDYLLRQGFGYDLIREKMSELDSKNFGLDADDSS